MTDEYWKKRAKELEQQHFEPAHKTQEKSLDDMLNQIPGMPQAPSQQSPVPQRNGEVDISSVMAQRLAQKMQTQGLPGNPVQEPVSQQANVVFIKEGVRAYRRLEADAFGHTMPLARFVGPINGVGGKEFEFKGVVRAYVVEGQASVDMSNIDPSQMKQLAVVTAPFVGTLLVPEGAIFGKDGPKRTILKG